MPLTRGLASFEAAMSALCCSQAWLFPACPPMLLPPECKESGHAVLATRQ